MKNFAFIILSFALLLGGRAPVAAQERTGKVEFSDSNILSGIISLTPGSQLKIQAGASVRVLALDRVREIRCAPETEEMERAWRFKEAGQTAKEFFGEPYPVRHLLTTITLADGETITGHLYTTVFYVADGENVQKVILLAKQRGKEGGTYQSLVYPKQITFGDPTAAATAMVKLKLSGLGAKPEVIAITRGALVRLEAKRSGTTGEWEMPSPLGREFFLAVKNGSAMRVGWPAAADEKLLALVRAALPNAEDFFNDRRILGAVEDPANAAAYSLVLAMRTAQTYGTSNQTWRLELYRWKLDDDRRVMLAEKNYFFRGAVAKNEPPPVVELSAALWQIHPVGGVWTMGNE